MVVAIDNFFGCYLLYSTNPKYKGRTYIGFTVNPERRIQQHNSGKHKGGAWKTSGKGPWNMALIIHGFPSDIAALRFEWAWQNPTSSRRLKHVEQKRRKESGFQYRVRVVASMLCQTPWKRLPLTVRWLMQEYAVEMEPMPPPHMPIAYGPVTAKVKKHKLPVEAGTSSKLFLQINDSETKKCKDDPMPSDEYVSLIDRLTACKPSKRVNIDDYNIRNCFLCQNVISNEDSLSCLNEDCQMISHVICLAKKFLSVEEKFLLVPVEGCCPSCKCSLLWGDLIRNSQGFHQYLNGIK